MVEDEDEIDLGMVVNLVAAEVGFEGSVLAVVVVVVAVVRSMEWRLRRP